MSDNFGTLGDLNKYRGSQKPTGLPQWLIDQMSANTTVDEGGGQRTEYGFNNNPFGGFERGGKHYVQVGRNKLKDPRAYTTDPELGDITEVGNVNDINPNGPNYWMLLAALSAGALGTAAGVGAAAGEGGGAAAGAGALAGDESLGLAGTGSYAGGSAAGGSTAGALAGDESAGLSMGAPGAGSGGGLAQLGTQSGAPVTDLSTTASSPSLAQQAGNYVTNNPAQAARLGLGLASLGASAAGTGSHANGTPTDAGSIIDQMANANRVDQNTPIGSRAWSQGPDGRWTVNDTMSAPEQANFENVQGMNAGMTGYTRDMLARLLSAPARGRADAPINIGGRIIGG
jgi:hypothetical protein